MLILIMLPGFSSMVPVARMALRNLLPGCPRLGDAELIVTELATNAVLHSTSRGTQFELSLDVNPGRLRIEVRDGGPFGYPPPAPLAAPAFPMPPWTALYEEDQHRDRDAELEVYGYGLALISSACDSWGHSRYPDHAVWWAELAWPDSTKVPSPAPARAPAPNATPPNTSAPNAAPPNVTAPNVTEPNAAAPNVAAPPNTASDA